MAANGRNPEARPVLQPAAWANRSGAFTICIKAALRDLNLEAVQSVLSKVRVLVVQAGSQPSARPGSAKQSVDHLTMSRSILGSTLRRLVGHPMHASWTVRARLLFIMLAASLSWAVVVASVLLARL